MTAPKLSKGDHALLLAMERHLDSCYGKTPRFVFHELFSPLVHVDIHVIPPSGPYPMLRLVTCGMAERPMNVPAGFMHSSYAELTIALPPDWPLGHKVLRDPRFRWPIELLQHLARAIHHENSYLWDGHTHAWNDPPEPVAPDTGLSSCIVLPPSEAPDGFDEFVCGDKSVNILGLIPLHTAELTFVHERGTDELYERLIAGGVTDVVDVARASVV